MRRYFSGEMSADETKQIEDNLAADEELMSSYNAYCSLENNMPVYQQNSLKEEALKKSIQQLNKAYFNNGQTEDTAPAAHSRFLASAKVPVLRATRIKAVWQWGMAAAGIAGIIILSVSLYMARQKPGGQVLAAKPGIDTPVAHATTPQQNELQMLAGDNVAKKIKAKALYKANFKPDAVPATTDGPLQDAFESYQSGHFAQAAVLFDNITAVDATRGEQEDTLLLSFYKAYYKGLCYMATGKFSKARANLQTAVEQSPGKTLKTKVQWYLALVYLNTGDAARCENLLKQLAAGIDPFYKTRATSLLNNMQAK